MIRQKLIENNVGQGRFRWRSHEISRIEGLSDAVFGFAITLLVVSLEVPKTFSELAETMNGFGAFALSFMLLFLVWFNQHKFFRRYGLQDATTVWLNAALLFVVLFYVYPLKFLFTFLVDRFTGGHGEVRLPNGNIEEMIQNDQQMGTLMLIFGLGYLAVFGVFVLLHLHAYRKRHQLQLTEVECFDTVSSIQESGLNCVIALVSISIVLFAGARFSGLAGVTYMATGIVMGIHGFVMGSRRKKLENRLNQQIDNEVLDPDLVVENNS
jgi:transmembrane protein TMEM174 (potassium channel)